jgi:hypothetical protein
MVWLGQAMLDLIGLTVHTEPHLRCSSCEAAWRTGCLKKWRSCGCDGLEFAGYVSLLIAVRTQTSLTIWKPYFANTENRLQSKGETTLKAFKIIAFGNPSLRGFREGIAVAENEDAAVEMCGDPTAMAFPIALQQCDFADPHFIWTHRAA